MSRSASCAPASTTSASASPAAASSSSGRPGSRTSASPTAASSTPPTARASPSGTPTTTPSSSSPRPAEPGSEIGLRSTGRGVLAAEVDAGDGDVVGARLLDDLAAGVDFDAEQVAAVGNVGDVEVLVGEVPGVDVGGADGDAHGEVRPVPIGGVAVVEVGGGVTRPGDGVGQRRGPVTAQ